MQPCCAPTSTRRAKKSGPEIECLGRSRSRISPKIHACVDALGNAVRLVTTAGQTSNYPQALGLLEDLDTRLVIAGISRDSDANRAYCAGKSLAVVIPSRPNRLEPVPLDEECYRDWNKMARSFDRLKQCRRLATRYDKTIVSFLAF